MLQVRHLVHAINEVSTVIPGWDGEQRPWISQHAPTLHSCAAYATASRSPTTCKSVPCSSVFGKCANSEAHLCAAAEYAATGVATEVWDGILPAEL